MSLIMGSFKSNPTSIPTTIVDEKTGQERKRMVNKQRWKGWAPISITYGDAVPSTPPPNAQIEEPHANAALLAKLREVFLVHFVWMLPESFLFQAIQ
jgi:general transcription factor 3C polypeptide 5 (transcription factor C subunit 1)